MNRVLAFAFQPRAICISETRKQGHCRQQTTPFSSAKEFFASLHHHSHRVWSVDEGKCFLVKMPKGFIRCHTRKELNTFLAKHCPDAWIARNQTRFQKTEGFSLFRYLKLGFIFSLLAQSTLVQGQFVTSEITVSQTDSNANMFPDVALLDDGLVYCWQRIAGANTAVFGRKTSGDIGGGSEFNWNFDSSRDVTHCQVEKRSGGFHGVAQKIDATGFLQDIYGDRFQSDTSRVFQAQTLTQVTDGNQYNPQTAPLASSSFALIHETGPHTNEPGLGIWANTLDSVLGRSDPNDKQIVNDKLGDQIEGSVDSDGNSDYVTCLTDKNSGALVSKRFKSSGLNGSPFTVSGSTAKSMHAKVRYIGDGNLGYVWLEQSGSTYQLKAAKHKASDASSLISAKDLPIAPFDQVVEFDFCKKTGGLVLLLREPGSSYDRLARYEFDSAFTLQGCKSYIDDPNGDSSHPVVKNHGNNFVAVWQKTTSGVKKVVSRIFSSFTACPTPAPTTRAPTASPTATSVSSISSSVPTTASAAVTTTTGPFVSPNPTPFPTPIAIAFTTLVPTMVTLTSTMPPSEQDTMGTEEPPNIVGWIVLAVSLVVCSVVFPIAYLVWKKHKNAGISSAPTAMPERRPGLSHPQPQKPALQPSGIGSLPTNAPVHSPTSAPNYPSREPVTYSQLLPTDTHPSLQYASFSLVQQTSAPSTPTYQTTADALRKPVQPYSSAFGQGPHQYDQASDRFAQ